MRRLPSLTALRAFEAAARLGSFTRAGDELHQTPSAISHQIRGLETDIGRALFLRHHRQVELTADGARLLDTLGRSFDMIEATCADLRRDETLSVHCAPSFASKWLGPRLSGFMQRHPDIRISMSATFEPVDLLTHEEYDLAIAYGAPRSQHGVVVESLGIERVAPLCAPSLLEGRRDLSLAEIAQLPLIESAVSPIHWSDWFALQGWQRQSGKRMLSFDRAHLAISAATEGLGVVLESTRLAQHELAQGTLIQLAQDLAPIERDLHVLLYRQVQSDRLHISAFRAWLLAECAADAGG
jgi:DNA-binding transcriptional LysR family regulator